MLLNNFFYIDRCTHDAGQITASIRIEAGHAILKGHFPQQAVVPGVCMMEMLKEVLQQVLGNKLMLVDSPVIKFLNMFTPQMTHTAIFTINYQAMESDMYRVQADLHHDSVIFLKCKGNYSVL